MRVWVSISSHSLQDTQMEYMPIKYKVLELPMMQQTRPQSAPESKRKKTKRLRRSKTCLLEDHVPNSSEDETDLELTHDNIHIVVRALKEGAGMAVTSQKEVDKEQKSEPILESKALKQDTILEHELAENQDHTEEVPHKVVEQLSVAHSSISEVSPDIQSVLPDPPLQSHSPTPSQSFNSTILSESTRYQNSSSQTTVTTTQDSTLIEPKSCRHVAETPSTTAITTTPILSKLDRLNKPIKLLPSPRYRVGLSKRAHVDSLHSYLKK